MKRRQTKGTRGEGVGAQGETIVRTLLLWHVAYGRELPWKDSRDAYAIWISEVMLQQTQLATVIPYWKRWMSAFPTVADLARADEEKVLKLWEGLGYYHRARNLQRAAQLIMREHGGNFPTRHEQVLALPGVGRYTAGAVCSIAYNQPAPILDGNVTRVLSRLFAIRGNPQQSKVNQRLWQLAEDLVQIAGREPQAARACARINQGLMQFGGLVCTPANPRCGECPLQTNCRAHGLGKATHFPQTAKRTPLTPRHFAAFVIERDGQVLVNRRSGKVVNAGLWEFPNLELPEQAPLSWEQVPALLRQHCGLRAEEVTLLAQVRHSITRYRILLEAFRCEVTAGANGTAGQWVPVKQLGKLPFAAAHAKVRAQLLKGIGKTSREEAQMGANKISAPGRR